MKQDVGTQVFELLASQCHAICWNLLALQAILSTAKVAQTTFIASGYKLHQIKVYSGGTEAQA